MVYNKVNFDSESDIPSLAGKVVLVTGGNNGLGKQCVLEYARHNPARIWLAARSPDKAQAAIDEINKEVPDAPITFLEMNLASLKSVQKAAQTVLAESDRLDILMLNAGIMASPAGLTEDGYEMQFGVNHMGHALLAKLLLPLMERTAEKPDADVRIVCVSSDGHNFAPKGGFLPDTCKTKAENLSALARYGQSKTCNILFARALASRYPKLTAVAAHPGVVRTGLASSFNLHPWLQEAFKLAISPFAATLAQGARNQLWGSVGKGVESGEYYEPVGVTGKGSANSQSDELTERLWEYTMKELEGWDA